MKTKCIFFINTQFSKFFVVFMMIFAPTSFLHFDKKDLFNSLKNNLPFK